MRDLGLRDEGDSRIFFAAREAGVIVMTKDRDFADLVHLHGAPLQVIWLTCGNTSNVHLQRILTEACPAAQEMRNGERLVEIGG